jgi:acid phosphatase
MYFNAGTTNCVPYAASIVYDEPYPATFNWPEFAFVSPNLAHDMHDGPDIAAKVANGDTWLSEQLPPLIAYARTNNGLIILTMDEDDYGAEQHVPTILVGDRIAAGQLSLQEVTHYNVTKTITDNFGVEPLGQTAGLLPLVPVP